MIPNRSLTKIKKSKFVFSEVISGSKKTIDDQYLHLHFFSSKVPVHCCSVENVF